MPYTFVPYKNKALQCYSLLGMPPESEYSNKPSSPTRAQLPKFFSNQRSPIRAGIASKHHKAQVSSKPTITIQMTKQRRIDKQWPSMAWDILPDQANSMLPSCSTKNANLNQAWQLYVPQSRPIVYPWN